MLVFLLSWIFTILGSYLLRFIGIFIMVSAIFSPAYLFNYTNAGDHIIMQSITGIDSILWIACWMFIGGICLLHAYSALTFKAARFGQATERTIKTSAVYKN